MSSSGEGSAADAASADAGLLIVMWLVLFAGRRVPGAGGPLGRSRLGALGVDVVEKALDAIAAGDGFVEKELQRRHALQPQPAANLTAQERRGAPERAR